MNRQYIFWGHSDPPHCEWHIIPNTPEDRATAIQAGATAFSTVSFSAPPEKGKPEPAAQPAFADITDAEQDLYP